jgi:hypothetical protein
LKRLDWYFWGPGIATIIICFFIFTQATKLSDGSYMVEPSLFTYFLGGLLVVCFILLIFGRVRETMGGRVNGKTVLYTAVAAPLVAVVVYFINN